MSCEPETEYDPESGVEVEICRTCEDLTNNLRTHAARLQRLDDNPNLPAYESIREDLIRRRDLALEELGEHERRHSDELDESQSEERDG